MSAPSPMRFPSLIRIEPHRKCSAFTYRNIYRQTLFCTEFLSHLHKQGDTFRSIRKVSPCYYIVAAEPRCRKIDGVACRRAPRNLSQNE